MTRSPLLLLALLLLVCPAQAAEDHSLPEGLAGMVKALGRPAAEAVVDRYTADATYHAAPAGLELVAALQQTGGRAAAEGLARLVRAGETRVRRAALDALGHLGLRTRAVAREVRRATSTLEVECKAAALRALSRVGSGVDVPLLLDALWAKEGAVRAAALDALGRLSGLRLPADRHRLDLWWSAAKAQDLPTVAPALAALEDACLKGEDPRLHRELILRVGWLDLETVEQRIATWRASSTPALRAEALLIATHYRLD